MRSWKSFKRTYLTTKPRYPRAKPRKPNKPAGYKRWWPNL